MMKMGMLICGIPSEFLFMYCCILLLCVIAIQYHSKPFVLVLDFSDYLTLPWTTVIEIAVYNMKIFLCSSSDLCIRFVHLHGSMADKF